MCTHKFVADPIGNFALTPKDEFYIILSIF